MSLIKRITLVDNKTLIVLGDPYATRLITQSKLADTLDWLQEEIAGAHLQVSFEYSVLNKCLSLFRFLSTHLHRTVFKDLITEAVCFSNSESRSAKTATIVSHGRYHLQLITNRHGQGFAFRIYTENFKFLASSFCLEESQFPAALANLHNNLITTMVTTSGIRDIGNDLEMQQLFQKAFDLYPMVGVHELQYYFNFLKDGIAEQRVIRVVYDAADIFNSQERLYYPLAVEEGTIA